MDTTAIQSQIDRLLADSKRSPSLELQNRLYHGTVTLMQKLYGTSSSQENDLRDAIQRVVRTGHPTISSNISACVSLICGSLEGMKADIAGHTYIDSGGNYRRSLVRSAQTLSYSP